MLIRKVPGAVGVRPARTFLISSAQYLEAQTGFGLGANDPFYVVFWSRRDAATSVQYHVLLGGAGTINDSRHVRTGAGTLLTYSIDSAGSASAATTAASGYVSGAGWYAVVAEWASVSSRRLLVNGTEFASTTTRTLTAAPSVFRIGRSTEDTSPMTGAISHVAIFAGTASAALIALHQQGVHPTQLPGQLLECWDLDRVGPIVGLVRGTVLTPVNGGGLTAGPTLQGPPALRRFFVEGVGGGTDYTLSADPGTATASGVAAALKYGRKLAADAGSAVSTGVAAALEYGREIAASAGTAIASTVAATLLWMRRLVGLDGAVEVTGTDATLSRDRVLKADAGDVDLTGTPATLTYSGGSPPVKKTFMLMGIQK